MPRPNWNSGQVSQWGSDVVPSGTAEGQTLYASSNAPLGRVFGSVSSVKVASATRYYLGINANYNSTANIGSGWEKFASWTPCYTHKRITIDSIATYVFVGEAGSTCRFGIYNADSTFLPGTLLADYGTVSGATTGQKDASGSTVVNPGVFWLATWFSNHTAVRFTSVTYTVSNTFFGDTVANNSVGQMLRLANQDYSAGFPASYPGGATIVNGGPAVYYRFT